MSHGLALKSDGSLWGWGYDYYHQLGPYVPVSEMTPRQIGSETDWVAVDGGRTFTVAVKADGSVWAWGGQEYGVLGNGKEEFDFVIDPVRVTDSSGSPINLSSSSDDGGDDGGGDASGVEAFVTRFYQQCLNREPDSGGLRTWSDALTAGTMTGADVAKAFILSPEFIARDLSDDDFVTVLYRAFFGREPDQAGYTAWLDRLAQGATREEAVGRLHPLGRVRQPVWGSTGLRLIECRPGSLTVLISGLGRKLSLPKKVIAVMEKQIRGGLIPVEAMFYKI